MARATKVFMGRSSLCDRIFDGARRQDQASFYIVATSKKAAIERGCELIRGFDCRSSEMIANDSSVQGRAYAAKGWLSEAGDAVFESSGAGTHVVRAAADSTELIQAGTWGYDYAMRDRVFTDTERTA